MKIIKALLLASLVAVGLPAVLNAEDNWSPPVSLFDRTTLAGWEYGSPDHSGWTIRDGVLNADNPKSPLVSGWRFGDFELEFKCSVEKDSGLEIKWINADPDGFSPGLRLTDRNAKEEFFPLNRFSRSRPFRFLE